MKDMIKRGFSQIDTHIERATEEPEEVYEYFTSVLNGLPPQFNPMDDAFMEEVESLDPKESPERLKELMEEFRGEFQ